MTDTPRKAATLKRSVKELIATAQRAVRTVDICLRADLVDEYELLEARIAKAKEAAQESLGGVDTGAMEARMAELRAEMAENSVTFRIRGLPKREFAELASQYPPREDNQRDAFVGFNLDEVVEQLIRRGTEEPVLDEDDWLALLGEALNTATYEKLTAAAWAVNKVDVSAPF